MCNLKKTALLAFTFLISMYANAQSIAAAPNTDVMRSAGKIYVVLAVVLTILVGLIVYVFRLDRKISRLEKGGQF